MNRRMNTSMATLLGAACCCLLASQLAAQTTWQLPGTGDFFTPGNWSNGVPIGGVNAIINQGTPQAAAPTPHFMEHLTIGGAAGSTGALEINGADLRPVQVEVGKFGTGHLTINSGYLDNSSSNESIFIGGHDDAGGAAGVGTLTMNGGYLHSADDIQLGRNGHGTLEFTGGIMRGVYTVIGKFGTGVWNQSGGVYAQDGGDFEIGDGGNPSQTGVPGPSEGFVNLSGGVIQVANRFAMGNRIGSSQITINGGALSITGAESDTTLYVGRGADWTTKEGGTHELRIVGGEAIVAAATDLQFDPNNVFQSAKLVAEITGSSHTPILVGRNAVIGNGILEVALNGYSPQSGDSWTLIETGVDLTNTVAAIDALVAAEGPLDINGDGMTDGNDRLTHLLPHMTGTVMGQFKDLVTTSAPLTAGLEWMVDYSDNTAVVLRVIGEATPELFGDYNGDGVVDAADYVVWRNNLNENITLPGEDPTVTPGQVTIEDYAVWKDNFGNMANPGALAVSAAVVPEPTSLVTIVLGMLAAGSIATRTRRTGG